MTFVRVNEVFVVEPVLHGWRVGYCASEDDWFAEFDELFIELSGVGHGRALSDFIARFSLPP